MTEYLQRAKSLLGETKTLPVLPASAQRIIDSTTDEFITLKTLAGYIEKDPSISARIVGLANSAFYAQRTEIRSVEDAIIRVLGLDLTRGIAIGMACSSVLGSAMATGFNQERYWRSSLSRSALSSSIASTSSALADDKSMCSLAGLLSNIGLLAAVAIAPKQTDQAILASHTNLRAEMVSVLGCDYLHISAALAEIWTLPQPIQDLFLARTEFIEQDSASFPPLHACLYLVDALHQHDAQTVLKLPYTPQLTESLGLTQTLIDISVSHEDAKSGIKEIANAIAA